jgi:GTPase SAR1 family protein
LAMKNLSKKKQQAKPVESKIEIFRKQVEKELQKRSGEEVVRFAWRCAVRTLPFLGVKGNFDFWKKEDRQKHLQAILYALDISYADDAKADDAKAAAYAAYAAKAYADDAAYAKAAAYAADYDDYDADDDADDAAKAAYAAKAAAYAAYAKAAYADAYADAAYAAAYAAYAADYDADINYFFHLILNELLENKTLGGGGWINWYGPVWENFQKALENNGCSYWARLYQSIFDNNFEMDMVALEQRLNVPAEIRNKGAAEVGRYLEDMEEQGVERLNEARILILGDKGAGKTCLARRLKDPNAIMTTDEESTPGVDLSIWKLEKENVNVHIWDFAGHTVTHAVHQFFLSERCLYIIVYDGRTEGRNRLEYWLDHMINYGKDSKALILVNKRDDHAVGVRVNWLKEHYPIIDVCTFSIQNDKQKLERFRQEAADYINSNPSWNKQQIPANSYKVKNELEKLFKNGNKNGKELIKRNEFEAIAQKCQVEREKMDSLLSDLHDLGISLWYKDIPGYNTLVLNPEWISNGVYRIINWANNQRKHCLKLSEFSLVFENDVVRYPESQHRFLYELMKKYELAYEAKEKDVLIIPRLLHEDQPVNMPQFQIGESLMARYKADQPLMPDSISRFIVKHNEEIKKEARQYLVWRSGVILEKIKGTIALVREIDDRTITVSVKGPNQTEYLSSLRETLNGIFEGYKSKKPELQYSVERFGEIEEIIQNQLPLWLSDNKILTHAQYGIPYFDENSKQQIVLNQTVQIYNITAQTLLLGTENRYLDQSTHNTFNFKDCNISLQGNLNDLARQLTKSGKTEEAKELKEAAELLAEAEECTKPAELKKKGIAAGLQRFAEKLGDEKSSLCKTIKGIEKGIDIAQDIAKGYNNIAQWAGLPQVPNVFLKKE